MSKASNTRIYLVSHPPTATAILVEAYSQEHAIRHVTQGVYRAEVASSKTVADLMTRGYKVEKACKPAQMDAFKPE